MKITKLKNGYSIRVSDSEFEVMQVLNTENFGCADPSDFEIYRWSPACKRVITEVLTEKRDWMIVTENRRK